jgi:hypothetical protein
MPVLVRRREPRDPVMNPDSARFVVAYLRGRRLYRERIAATGRLFRLYAVSLNGRGRNA